MSSYKNKTAQEIVNAECHRRDLVVRERNGMLNLRTPGLGGEWVGPMCSTYEDLAEWLCPHIGFILTGGDND